MNENVAEFCNPPQYYHNFSSSNRSSWPSPPPVPVLGPSSDNSGNDNITGQVYGNAVRIQSIEEQGYDPNKDYKAAFQTYVLSQLFSSR
jgi:hypothetical protein